MAFNPRAARSGQSARQGHVKSAPSPSDGLDPAVSAVLRPSAEALGDLALQPADVVSQQQRMAHANMVRGINAIRTVTPILAYSLSVDGTPREQSRAFSSLLGTCNRVAHEILSKIGGDPPQRWQINSLERGIAQIIVGMPPEKVDQISGMLSDIYASRSEEFESEVYQPLGGAQVVMSSLVQALSPVIAARMEFDFHRKSMEKDLSAVRDAILSAVLSAMERLSPSVASEADRHNLFRVLMQESGDLMASAWRFRAVAAKSVLSGKTRAEMAAWKKASPGGFPLDSVFEQYAKSMDHLCVIAGSVHLRKP